MVATEAVRAGVERGVARAGVERGLATAVATAGVVGLAAQMEVATVGAATAEATVAAVVVKEAEERAGVPGAATVEEETEAVATVEAATVVVAREEARAAGPEGQVAAMVAVARAAGRAVELVEAGTVEAAMEEDWAGPVQQMQRCGRRIGTNNRHKSLHQVLRVWGRARTLRRSLCCVGRSRPSIWSSRGPCLPLSRTCIPSSTAG